MSIGAFLEKAMGMDEAAWARHTNPLSGWSRISILPLLALAVWGRAWLGWWALLAVAAVLVWTWINPRLFAPPKSTDNWMSRGVLGERMWLNDKNRPIPDHHRRVTRILGYVSALGIAILAIGLFTFDVGLVVAGLISTMGAKLWFLDRMVWLHQDMIENSDQD